MLFRHPLRAACLAPLCLIVQLAFLVAPHAAYAVGTADGYVSVGTTTNPTSEFGVYGGATIGSSYNNMLAPTNGLLVQGNVGIGTTGPASPLVVLSPNNAAATNIINTLSSNGVAGVALGYNAIRELQGNTNLSIDANGTGNLLLQTNATGNVGIGTTSPQSILQIGSAFSFATGTDQINFNSFYNSGASQYQSLGSGYSGQVYQDTAGNGNMYIRTSAGSAAPGFGTAVIFGGASISLTPAGLVGIGTTSPSNKLDVSGGMAVGAAYVGTNNAPSNGMIVQGNVGIGTTAPQSKLQIQSGEVQVGSSGASCSAANAGAISYASGALSYCNGAAWTSAASGIGSTGYDALWTSPTAIGTGLIYESGGKVGIGTTSPTQKLEIYNSTNAGTSLQITTPGTQSLQQAGVSLVTLGDGNGLGSVTNLGWAVSARGNAYTTAAQKNDLQFFYWNGSTYNSNLYLAHGGNVGIGTTTPVATLDINGYAHLAKNSSQPIACDAAHDGSLALASTRRPCECVGSAWIDVVYGTACSW